MPKKNILILSTEYGTERDELVVPLEKLKELGHDVTLATPSGDPVQTLKHDKDPADKVPADTTVAEATGTYDVIVLPGGALNADHGRTDEGIRRLVKAQAGAGRSIAAICHAGWILVEDGLTKGKDLTSYPSIRTDLENAGATWQDQALVKDDANGWTLVTSRNPGDLDVFVKAIDEL
ncbi:protease I [Raineyella antarctica]|uniref:Protease I n=1 Tax=Raineyella antarctica TaxID=1577474 RepID=A0A1G6GP76_9ACTN|nr:DJ-1/PfpI family protein [Raineyella antarctica]SDB83663.1 protease I [Raineyella antarctica]